MCQFRENTLIRNGTKFSLRFLDEFSKRYHPPPHTADKTETWRMRTACSARFLKCVGIWLKVMPILLNLGGGVSNFTKPKNSCHFVNSLVRVISIFFHSGSKWSYKVTYPVATVGKNMVQLTTTNAHSHSDQLLSFRLFNLCVIIRLG